MMFNPLDLGFLNWILYVAFMVGVIGAFILYFHADSIEEFRQLKKKGVHEKPSSYGKDANGDAFPSHIKDFMDENGGSEAWSKEREVTPEEAQKMMEEL